MKRETPQQLDAIALQVRRRVLRWFAHRGLLDGDAARDMLLWAKPGAAPTPPAYPPAASRHARARTAGLGRGARSPAGLGRDGAA